MRSDTVSFIRRNRLPSILGVIAIGIVAWMIFSPNRVAEIHEVPPALLAQVQAAVRLDRPLARAVWLQNGETASDGERSVRKQLAQPLTPTVLRRSNKRYRTADGIALLDESTSLAIGPIVLLRHSRVPTPVLADLLPRHFWHTWRLTKVEVKPGSTYPGKPGSKFEATMWAEFLYENGEVRFADQTELSCVAIERAPARNLHAALTGEATKVRCEETGPVNPELAKTLAVVLGSTPIPKDAKLVGITESWYIEDLGLTVQIRHEEKVTGVPEFDGEGLVTTRTVEKVELGAPLKQ